MDEPLPPDVQARVRTVWSRARERFGAYEAVLPGDPSFTCIADECEARCCRVFSVAVSDADAERMMTASGRDLSELIEFVDGEPLTVPMAEPYLLRRRDSRCGQLAGHQCGIYEGRPAACRLYPFQILLLDVETGRPIYMDASDACRAVRRMLDGAAQDEVVPVLVRHIECPGFIGAPLGRQAWVALVAETAELQFAPDPKATASNSVIELEHLA